MKNFLTTLFCAASVLAASSSNATDWFFDYSKGYNATWSTMGGTADTDGMWKTSDGTHIRGSLPSVDDTVTLGDSSNKEPIFLAINQDVTIKGFNAGGNSASNSSRVTIQSGKTLTVLGDINRLANVGQGMFYGGKVYVGGNINMIGGGNMSFDNGMQRLEVMGNVTGTSGGSFFTQVGTVKKTFDEGFANPDAIVHGIVDNVLFFAKGGTYDTFTQLGGIKGNGSVSREYQAGRATTSYVTLKNTIEYTASGAITEVGYPNMYNTSDGGKLTIIMNGSAQGSQTFSTNSAMFFGGIKAMSGTIRFNFNQNASKYQYFSDKSNETKTIAVTSKGGSTQTTFSHGNLEMLGGIFGASAASDSYGAFRFTNIVYTSGTINLRLSSADKVDSIDLTGYWLKTVGVAEDVAVAGGSISRIGEGKVTFDFGRDLLWLIDSELNGGKGVKIVAWDSANKTSLTSSDFAANSYSNAEKDYTADFTVADDGLYVKYIAAVPEPAALAALFGALALAFAAWRRNIRLG